MKRKFDYEKFTLLLSQNWLKPHLQMGKKKIRINFFSRLQSKKSTPPSLDGGILIIGYCSGFYFWLWEKT